MFESMSTKPTAPARERRLMCVLAHPDDESLGTGGILARYAAEGVGTYVISATRGERGWPGDPAANPGLEALGQIRERELRAAAEVLGLREAAFLDYLDGDLDRAEPSRAVGKLVTRLRRIRPQVVVTFDPTGYYGHPDHIAISQLTTAAIVAAADAGYRDAGGRAAHRVAKLYYLAPSERTVAIYERALGPLAMRVGGVERRAVAWRDWAITTHIDAADHWRTVWRAVACHRSQLPGYEALRRLPDEDHRTLWGTQTFYRAMSMVNGGRELERDLFEGL
ncbi:MAG TPA: PIG-L family deacetylase [Roseiflexaceae bacterium]|nr:PIG-L family deacetylase [Roseiflexaceae bacterium]